MSELPVLVTKRDGIHTITLNRPAQLNAFTQDMHIALALAFDDAGKDPACRAIMVTGNSDVAMAVRAQHAAIGH